MSSTGLNTKKHSISEKNLRKVYALKQLPGEQLRWLAERLEFHEFENGSAVIKNGEPAVRLWFLCEGQVDYYIDVKGNLVYYYSLQNDTATGGVGGLIPYSRQKVSPGGAYACGKVKMFTLDKSYFPELEKLDPEFVEELIGYMTERVKKFATIKFQHEKVSALGKLSAGIAHEMNNPASAINRMSSELSKRFNRNFVLLENLLESKISTENLQNIRVLFERAGQMDNIVHSPLKRMQIDADINNWFNKNGLTGNTIVSETFADACFSAEDLENIKNLAGHEVLEPVLNWIENLLSSQRLIKDLGEASARISNLVGAIKSHVHMDQTNEMQLTDIERDIENTLTLLGYKLREKNIRVKKKFCGNHPRVPAYIGELNQAWMNIIDNAIYALHQNGELAIETVFEGKYFIVKFTDNGPGIPPEIITRIFDPFFTTKKIGEGIGIGLDTVSRIIKKHNGQIKADSEPGRTEFSISIPVPKTKTMSK